MVGYLGIGPPNPYEEAWLRRGLNEVGYVDGVNVAIQFRWENSGIQAAAADLVRNQVAVIVTESGPTILAAKAATSKIPIVFASGGRSGGVRCRRQSEVPWREHDRSLIALR